MTKSSFDAASMRDIGEIIDRLERSRFNYLDMRIGDLRITIGEQAAMPQTVAPAPAATAGLTAAAGDASEHPGAGASARHASGANDIDAPAAMPGANPTGMPVGPGAQSPLRQRSRTSGTSARAATTASASARSPAVAKPVATATTRHPAPRAAAMSRGVSPITTA